MAARKGGLAILLGEDGPKKSEDGDAKKEASQDLIDAIESGDAEAVKSAFQDLYDLCAAAESDEDEDEDEDEGEEY